MRSSTCTTCTLFQGTSSFARARNICQGVWPPLTAMTKRPRAATAARASVAMISAALLATALASVSISIFMVALPQIENGEWRTEDRHSLSSIFDTRSVSRSLPDSPSLRAVQLFGSLHSVPTYRARIRIPECLLLAPGQRCARPPPHSPRGQTRWRLLPWRHPAPVHKHPSPRHRDGGWLATLQVRRSSAPPGPSPSDQRPP